MWLIAHLNHQHGATAAVTQQLVIRILVFGWRRAKSCSTPIRWPCRDLFRSANPVTDMRVITSGLNANFTICMKGRLFGLLCPTEREAYCSVIMQNINFSKDIFPLCVFLFSWNEIASRISFICQVKLKGIEWRREIHNNSWQRIFLYKGSSENGVQHWGMKVLWFATICEPLSNTTVQPLPFFLKLRHKASVAAPASAMNTNTACRHVLCNKSATCLNVREENRLR